MIWVKIQFWLALHLIFRTKKHSIMLFPGIWWTPSWKLWFFNHKTFADIPEFRQFFFGGFFAVLINSYLIRNKFDEITKFRYFN